VVEAKWFRIRAFPTAEFAVPIDDYDIKGCRRWYRGEYGLEETGCGIVCDMN
jgi:hypothetical protein